METVTLKNGTKLTAEIVKEAETLFRDKAEAERKYLWRGRRALMDKLLNENAVLRDDFWEHLNETNIQFFSQFDEAFPHLSEYQLSLLLIPWLDRHLDYLEDFMDGIVTGEKEDPHDWTEIDASFHEELEVDDNPSWWSED